jgi:Ran GTPase-activating protein (RanGAP) involved in mRNA processing and transport
VDSSFDLGFDPTFGKPKHALSPRDDSRKEHKTLKDIEAEERAAYAAEQLRKTPSVESLPTFEVGADIAAEKKGHPSHDRDEPSTPVPAICAFEVESSGPLDHEPEPESDTPILADEEKQALQEVARKYLATPSSATPATATEESNKKFNSSPKAAVEAVKANDPSYTIVDLSGNTVFTMKHREYCEQLAEGLKSNTYVKEIHLSKVDLDARDATLLGEALEHNDSVEVVDLEKNKISNEGATALANSLQRNKRVIELNLLGQPNQFGDACLEAFIDLFDYNVTLTKIIWRLDSRKSFSINKLIVRNNTIAKWLQEGKDVSSKIPPKCFVKQLLILGNNSKPLATLRAEASGFSPNSPKVGRHGSNSALNSPSLSRHASPAPSSDPANAAPARVIATSSDSATSSPKVSRHVKEERSESPSASTPTITAPVADSPLGSSSSVLAQARASPAASPSVSRHLSKLRANESGAESGSEEGSPSLSKSEKRRSVLGSLRKTDAPSTLIASLEQNDPGMLTLTLEKNVSFAMKQQEYCARIGAALKTNTVCREINLASCSIDSTGAKLLAEGLAQNRTLRVLDLSANKIGNDGSQAIAEALMTNCSVNEINLLGQPGAFGESVLEVWLTMLSEHNMSLRKIIWRLDSRKSFPINKLIVRNNTIKKFLDEGKDLAQGQKDGLFKIPEKANCTVDFLKD